MLKILHENKGSEVKRHEQPLTPNRHGIYTVFQREKPREFSVKAKKQRKSDPTRVYKVRFENLVDNEIKEAKQRKKDNMLQTRMIEIPVSECRSVIK